MKACRRVGNDVFALYTTGVGDFIDHGDFSFLGSTKLAVACQGARGTMLAVLAARSPGKAIDCRYASFVANIKRSGYRNKRELLEDESISHTIHGNLMKVVNLGFICIATTRHGAVC